MVTVIVLLLTTGSAGNLDIAERYYPRIRRMRTVGSQDVTVDGVHEEAC
jgi:hypothetical protein